MKVSYNWLKEYLPIQTPATDLAEKITRTGIEVDAVIKPSEGMKKIVVGHVLSCVDHPDSDHLHICQVDVGEENAYQIICGAPNIQAGQDVIVALPNSRIADNVKIKKGKMRGEVSMGMICGLQEIGFDDSVVPKAFLEGIFVFPEPVAAGTPVFELLGMSDELIDLDLTPNRADALGMHGVAYEVAAIESLTPEFETVVLNESTTPITDQLTADVKSDKVNGYYLRKIENVTIKPSPLWLQVRLMHAGIRPINNIVDATNYSLLTYGQPLHAFDADKLAGHHLTVRQAKADEKLVTLDEQEHQLNLEDIVIADQSQPLALAGVMGGLNSSIDEQTKNIILEAAVFDNTTIRKTAQRHNLRTDASSRFEKGINTADVQIALDAAAQLIQKLTDSTVIKNQLIAKPIISQSTTITFPIARVNHVLGTALTSEEILTILARLNFDSEVTADQLIVNVPPRRWDIHIPADIIEEIARLYGYDNLPSTLPVTEMTRGQLNLSQKSIRHTQRQLQAAGLTQVISYALTTAQKAQAFMLEDANETQLDWPMTQDHAVLRMNLITGLLDDAAYNQARSQNDLAFYEQGRVFLKSDKQVRPDEVEYVAGLMTGQQMSNLWQDKVNKVDFFSIKGVVENFLNSFNCQADIRYEATNQFAQMHPGRTAAIYLQSQLIGFVGQVHPKVAKNYHLKETYVFQINLDALIAAPKRVINAVAAPKFPSITRDIALQVKEDVTNAQILAEIQAVGGQYLQQVSLFDLYQGEHIEAGQKSLAYTLTYQNPDATLTEEEINQAFEKVVTQLTSVLDAKIR